MGEDVEGRAWVTAKWRQGKLRDSNCVVSGIYIRGSVTKGPRNQLATLSASRAPQTGGIFDSAGWSMTCKAKDVLLSEVLGREAYLRRFVHLSICLAVVLEDRIPAFEVVGFQSATLDNENSRSPKQNDEQHTEIGGSSRRHNFPWCSSLE